ncbi:esterase-like activity of phytase family protein [Neptunicella sp. SCSIO 80796]|uniref:esterase-like activity of phytase family protein n=1 Tax=Neptunicella plasticusilytica TaxID=3117012 RepID=UPI003A4E2ADD
MKNKLALSISLALLMGLSGCSGDDGTDGSNGTDGQDGQSGLNSLISQSTLAMGDSQCVFGGTAFNSGLDSNSDGVLAENEISQTSYVCQPNPVSQSGSSLPYSVLRNDLTDGARPDYQFEIRNGGYGSDAAADPANKNRFYALTDRGPNAVYTGTMGAGKKFPVEDYTPRIGLFELQANGDVKKIKEILLKRPDGSLISGLPNSSSLGGTGETPYDAEGNPILVDNSLPYDEQTNPLKLDDYGLDGEGLVALSDGTFWISDEYGPHIVHFDAEGKEIERINAFADDERTVYNLPAEFANRRANRGMEGLTVTPDENTLVGIMQSTMHNPNSSVKNLDITRIVTIDLTTGEVGQYLYKQEKAQNSNSGIVALSAHQFALIERDGAFYNDTPSAMKYIYKIDLSAATNLEAISDSGDILQDPALGLTISGLTLEQVVLEQGWTALESAGIVPASKTLVADLVQQVSYPHDKMEGLWLIDSSHIGVLNDDDFATWSTDGELEQKYLDAGLNRVDQNTLYILDNLDLTTSE